MTSLLTQAAKDAVTNQPSAKDWGREAIRLVVEGDLSVEGVITQTKEALAWHHMNGLLDTDAKRAKFNNYFSTLRYLISGWASGTIPISERDDVLRGEASFLSLYARQKKLEREQATGFEEAIDRLTRVRVFAQNASPSAALRLKQEAMLLLDVLNCKLPGEPSVL